MLNNSKNSKQIDPPRKKERLDLAKNPDFNHDSEFLSSNESFVDAQKMHYVNEDDWNEFNNYKQKKLQLSQTSFLDVNPYKVLADTVKNPFDLNVLEQQFGIQELNQRKILAEEIKKDYIPTFFRTEKRLYLLKILFFIFLLSACFSVIFWLLWGFFTYPDLFKPGYFAIPSIIGIIDLVILIFNSVKFHFLKKEIKQMNNKFDEMLVSSNIQSIYKKLICSFSNINWYSVYVYLFCGFFILIMFIVFYFLDLNNFLAQATSGTVLGLKAPVFGSLTYGLKSNPDYWAPEIFVIVFSTFAGLTLINQVVLQLFNLVRMKRMEMAYKVPIITEESKQAIKSATNKRNFIIFLVLTIILGLIVFLLWRILKAKRK